MVGVLLAEEPSRGPDYGKASPIGLLVVVLLLIGVFALVRSMNRQLKKVPASFDEPEVGASETPETPDPGGPTPAGETTDAVDPGPQPDTHAPPRDGAP